MQASVQASPRFDERQGTRNVRFLDPRELREAARAGIWCRRRRRYKSASEGR